MVTFLYRKKDNNVWSLVNCNECNVLSLFDMTDVFVLHGQWVEDSPKDFSFACKGCSKDYEYHG